MGKNNYTATALTIHGRPASVCVSPESTTVFALVDLTSKRQALFMATLEQEGGRHIRALLLDFMQKTADTADVTATLAKMSQTGDVIFSLTRDDQVAVTCQLPTESSGGLDKTVMATLFGDVLCRLKEAANAARDELLASGFVDAPRASLPKTADACAAVLARAG